MEKKVYPQPKTRIEAMNEQLRIARWMAKRFIELEKLLESFDEIRRAEELVDRTRRQSR